MTTPADPKAHVRFLKAELDLGKTFTLIATQRYETGNDESAAGKSLANAEKAYETVSRFLSDPKHTKRLTDADIYRLTTGLHELRQELVRLERFRTPRTQHGKMTC
jgi:hypothetical protein